MGYVFEPAPIPAVQVTSGSLFPVRRIFCVGQNYAAHAREMGTDPVREQPVFFTKPADAVVAGAAGLPALLPYPPRTANLHPEVELVVAIGRGGCEIPAGEVDSRHVFGYAVGLDMTRRDLQATAKAKGQPWDMAKGFDRSAVLSAITPVSRSGILARGKIELRVNGELRQSGDLADMIWSVPEIVHQLSTLVELAPGDLIFTGTPAGIGPVVHGDRIEASVDGLDPLVVTIA